MTRRGFFGAIAAALGCARAPVWKRDPLRCAWHDGAGGVITDQELFECTFVESADVRTALQDLELREHALQPGCIVEANPGAVDGFMRRTYLNSQYGQVIQFSKELLDDDAWSLFRRRRMTFDSAWRAVGGQKENDAWRWPR